MFGDNAVQIGDGSNSDKETLKFRDYKIVECESNSNAHYLKDIGRIINLETKDKNSIVGAVNEIYKNLEFSLIVPNAISQSVIMTKDSDGKYKFSFTFNNAYITSNRLFDNDFKSQINNTFEINMLDAPEFNKPYYLYLEWDLFWMNLQCLVQPIILELTLILNVLAVLYRYVYYSG